MRRRLLIAVALLVAIPGVWLLWLLSAAGELRSLTPHFFGRCTAVEGVIGAEDITIDARTGTAYLSAYDRRAVELGGAANGAIFAYDLNAPGPRPVNLTPDAGSDFRPHGISLYVAPDGAATLYVIDHSGGRHTVQVFAVGADRLRHERTLADPLLVSPNDLLAVAPDRLYVTNDHHYAAGFMRVLEDYLRLPIANVVLWDGRAFREAAGGIRFANGINRSPDGTTIYVNALTGSAVSVYDYDTASGALHLRREIALGSAGDNIEIAADGTLWMAAHPKLLTLVRYMSGARPTAPSQILRVTPEGKVEEIYLDHGEQISAASVGAVHGERLLIGSIADDKFLDCRMQ